ncbi:MAG: hypothetical protein ARM1_0625 [Candidatus Micrarchaeota archaeon]|nr:MAG: hypothetical protein ARM1_0625 [Candidatus Micrarchaeota archaeon]
MRINNKSANVTIFEKKKESVFNQIRDESIDDKIDKETWKQIRGAIDDGKTTK